MLVELIGRFQLRYLQVFARKLLLVVYFDRFELLEDFYLVQKLLNIPFVHVLLSVLQACSRVDWVQHVVSFPRTRIVCIKGARRPALLEQYFPTFSLGLGRNRFQFQLLSIELPAAHDGIIPLLKPISLLPLMHRQLADAIVRRFLRLIPIHVLRIIFSCLLQFTYLDLQQGCFGNLFLQQYFYILFFLFEFLNHIFLCIYFTF